MDNPQFDQPYTKLRIKTKLFFKWFDIWIGLYIDRSGRAVYICPIPMVGIKISWWTETLKDRARLDGWKEAVEYIKAHVKLNNDFEDAIDSAASIVKELQ